MNNQVNQNETRSGKRSVLLKTGAIISIIIAVTSIFLITQIPPWSHSRTGMILTSIVGALTFLSFFLQLRQKDPK